ncbi:MAG: choice-of-anchor V domain-containing protein [Bacteroidota bacterium]
MKIKNIYKTFLFIGGAIFALGSSNGPGNVLGGQVTGAPGSFGQGNGQPGTCANTGCHGGGTFDPSISIELLDGTDVVDQYEPGKAYMLRITTTPGAGTPGEYGFQAVVLDEGDAQAGSWGDIGSGKQIVSLSDRDYLEHSTPSQSGTFEMEWIAPDLGTGTVTIYAAGNAANDNGNSQGDSVADGSASIQEGPPNSTSFASRDKASMVVLPNPVQDFLNLEINSRITGDHHIRIMDVMGRVVESVPVNIQVGKQVSTIGVEHLNSGLYVVQLCGEDHLTAVQMLKK